MATAAPPRTDKKPAPAPLPAILLDFPERLEHLDCPDLYAPHWLDIVTNLPPNQVRGMPLGEYMALVIKGWSFKTKDGQPAPITAEMMDSLPPDLWDWLVGEVVTRRDCPLAKRADSSPPPTT